MKIKSILIIWLTTLFITISAGVFAQGLYSEEQSGYAGLYVRIVNPSPYNFSCYITDGMNYHRFIVYAQSYGLWYPVSGPYQWQCQ